MDPDGLGFFGYERFISFHLQILFFLFIFGDIQIWDGYVPFAMFISLLGIFILAMVDDAAE